MESFRLEIEKGLNVLMETTDKACGYQTRW
jgi:hypothetical protein